MTCLDETIVADFVEGRLPKDREGTLLGHIDACGPCRSLVAFATRSFLVETTPDDETRRSTPTVLARGHAVAQYRILGVIGAGAMGVVYAAHDPRLDRKIALKILLEDTRSTARLLHEAQAMAKVSHPNVVTVHDVGMIGERVFLAMELVEGLTAARWLRAAPRAISEVLDVFRSAGRGLSAAHTVGLVLRDFKPDNILVGFDGRVRVTDFGLATSATQEPRGSATVIAGTPAYMAPEQARGAHLDARSDQYGFAVALYEALHGIHPTLGEVTGSPPAKGVVPRAVANALARALRHNPDERYPSMDALLAALRPRRPLVARASLGALVLAVALGAWSVVAAARAPAKGARYDAKLREATTSSAARIMPPAVADPAPAPESAPRAEVPPAAPKAHAARLAASARRPAASADTNVKHDCDPDFFVDRDGEKHFKPECFSR